MSGKDDRPEFEDELMDLGEQLDTVVLDDQHTSDPDLKGKEDKFEPGPETRSRRSALRSAAQGAVRGPVSQPGKKPHDASPFGNWSAIQ